MPMHSAGILMFRRTPAGPEILLVHPGGPFWQKKDAGAWSIPKGHVGPDEPPLAAAQREFLEETGFPAAGRFVDLGEAKQKSGKLIHAWAIEGDLDPAAIRSNTFQMEWPPRSGTMQDFPEVDRAGWFTIPEAREKLLEGQRPFLDALQRTLV